MRQGFSRYGLAVLVTLLLGGIVACGSETETTDRPVVAEPSAQPVPEPEPEPAPERDAEQDLGRAAPGRRAARAQSSSQASRSPSRHAAASAPTVARVHNILSGEMTLELVDGGSSIQGSISVQGSSGSGGPGIGSFYSAEFTGTRIGE